MGGVSGRLVGMRMGHLIECGRMKKNASLEKKLNRQPVSNHRPYPPHAAPLTNTLHFYNVLSKYLYKYIDK